MPVYPSLQVSPDVNGGSSKKLCEHPSPVKKGQNTLFKMGNKYSENQMGNNRIANGVDYPSTSAGTNTHFKQKGNFVDQTDRQKKNLSQTSTLCNNKYLSSSLNSKRSTNNYIERTKTVAGNTQHRTRSTPRLATSLGNLNKIGDGQQGGMSRRSSIGKTVYNDHASPRAKSSNRVINDIPVSSSSKSHALRSSLDNTSVGSRHVYEQSEKEYAALKRNVYDHSQPLVSPRSMHTRPSSSKSTNASHAYRSMIPRLIPSSSGVIEN